MRVPYLDLPRQFTDPALWEVIRAQLERAHFVGGEEIERFEAEFAALCQVKHAVGLNSGTDALWLSLIALGIGQGDEVITAPNSFIATAGAIAAVGARPVFVDVGADYNLEVSLVEAAVTRSTKAIIPVHLTGNPADMPAIAEIAGRHGLWVIEDAAQSVGARFDHQVVGSQSDAGGFSLHPLKNLNAAGDGGVLTTNHDDLADKVRKLRNHGLKNRDEIDFFGYNSRLDGIQAAIVRHGLRSLDQVTQKRRENAARYDRLLEPLSPKVTLPPRSPRAFQVFHTYVVQVEDREPLRAYLQDQGIETKVHYPIPLHLQAPAKALGYRAGDFPVCEAQSTRILTLPIHQHLSNEQIDFVGAAVARFYACAS